MWYKGGRSESQNATIEFPWKSHSISYPCDLAETLKLILIHLSDSASIHFAERVGRLLLEMND